jgi:hypothetical protein
MLFHSMCLMKRLYPVSYIGLLASLQVGELRFTVVPADEAETSAADADDGPPFVVAVRRQGSTGALRCLAMAQRCFPHAGATIVHSGWLLRARTVARQCQWLVLKILVSLAMLSV